MPETIFLSQVYRKLPAQSRICEGCNNVIQRNAALLDGVLYHYGCMKKREAQPSHMCNNCGSFLTSGKIVTVFIDGEKVRSCGLCGSTEVSWLGPYNQQERLAPGKRHIPKQQSQVQIHQA